MGRVRKQAPKHVFIIAGIITGLIATVHSEEGTKCLKEEVLGDREGNVYYCTDSTKTECCTEGGTFNCCEPSASKAWREQLILWGCVGGAVLVISLACVYFWRESLCCGGDGESKRCCCCCCRRKSSNMDDRKSLTPIPDAGGSKLGRSFVTPSWAGRDNFVTNRDDVTPPPFTYKQSRTANKY